MVRAVTVMSEHLTTDGASVPQKRGRGRPKGSRNRVSKDAQKFFQRLWNNPDFKKKFRKDWIDGKLQPQMYVTGASYAWGKPVDQISIDAAEGDGGPTAFVLVLNGKALLPDGDNSSGSE